MNARFTLRKDRRVIEERAPGARRDEADVLLAIARVEIEFLAGVPVVADLVIVPLREERDFRVAGAHVGIENMNLMCGLERSAGLTRRGLHP